MPVTLVLADDHPLTREGLRGYLNRDPNLSVLRECADGEEALEAVRDLRPEVALLDIRMPRRDGVAVARAIKEERLSTVPLMLTTYDAQQYVLSSLRAGARGYVLKSSPPETLIRAVHTVAKGGVYLDAEVAESVSDAPFSPEGISPREREVLVQASRGLSSKEIAARLIISERTVQTHLASIYGKLGAKNKTEAMLLALKYGMTTLEELLEE